MSTIHLCLFQSVSQMRKTVCKTDCEDKVKKVLVISSKGQVVEVQYCINYIWKCPVVMCMEFMDVFPNYILLSLSLNLFL